MDERLHGYRILGSTVITDPAARRTINESLRRHATNRDPRIKKACIFSPRHAIRITQAGEVVDLLICFECEEVSVIAATTGAGGFNVASAAEPAFNEALVSNNIPLAPKPGSSKASRK